MAPRPSKVARTDVPIPSHVMETRAKKRSKSTDVISLPSDHPVERYNLKKGTAISDATLPCHRSLAEKRTKRKTENGAIDGESVGLHHDVVFDHILPKLPVKPLLRFRLVCRSWRSLMDANKRFIELHRLHPQRNRMSITPFGGMKSTATTGNGEILHLESLIEPFSDICPSIDGLICLERSNNGEVLYRVINPWTRKKIDLPSMRVPIIQFSILARDPMSSVYKLFLLHKQSRGYESMIFTLGVNQNWRNLGTVPVNLAERYLTRFSFACLVNGAFHWLYESFSYGSSPTSFYSDYILAFDISKEKFRTMAYPKVPQRTNVWLERQINMSLTLAGGVLNFLYLDVSSATMGVWVLKDYSAQSWLRQYSFSCDSMPKEMIHRPFHIFGVIQGRVMMWFGYFSSARKKETLLIHTSEIESRPGITEKKTMRLYDCSLEFRCQESLLCWDN